MGLDCSHDAWHGAYSAFMRWRQEIAKAAGLPPLELMEGFYSKLGGDGLGAIPTLYTPTNSLGGTSRFAMLDARLPISWDCLKPSALHELLYHSDCDGEIPADSCGPIADALEALLPALTGDLGGHIGDVQEKTRTFIIGLRKAAAAGEPLKFY